MSIREQESRIRKGDGPAPGEMSKGFSRLLNIAKELGPLRFVPGGEKDSCYPLPSVPSVTPSGTPYLDISGGASSSTRLHGASLLGQATAMDRQPSWPHLVASVGIFGPDA